MMGCHLGGDHRVVPDRAGLFHRQMNLEKCRVGRGGERARDERPVGCAMESRTDACHRVLPAQSAVRLKEVRMHAHLSRSECPGISSQRPASRHGRPGSGYPGASRAIPRELSRARAFAGSAGRGRCGADRPLRRSRHRPRSLPCSSSAPVRPSPPRCRDCEPG